jgi:hypothetical protein
MKYKTLMILIMAVMMPFLMVPSEASAETPILSNTEITHAKAVNAQHLEELMGLPGVHGVGIGEEFGHIGILILVDNESRTSHMPKTVEDVPAIVWAVGEITAHQINLGVDGGNNIVCNGYCASGTVGFKVCDNTTSGVGGFITNNHVAAIGCPGLCPNNAPLGTNFFSPSFCDGGTTNVGTLNRFIPIVLDDFTLNYIDAAFVQSTDAQVSNNIQGIGPQNNTVATAYLGQAVCKSGRTSGLTCGTVTGINLTIRVNYSDVGNCGIAIFNNQVMYSPTPPYTVMSQSGDSGSPVMEANTNAAVALNFAGDTSGDGFGNPIGAVLSELQVSLCSSISDVTDPFIDKILGVKEPGLIVRLIGTNFGDTQDNSIVHIGPKVFDSSSLRIKLWSDTKIKIKLPNYQCGWFKGKDFRYRKVWVTVDGVDSNKKRIKVLIPSTCQ